MIPAWAKVGAEVTVTNDGLARIETAKYESIKEGEVVDEILPEFGAVYSIRKVFSIAGRGCMYLSEIHNKPEQYQVTSLIKYMELPFLTEDFRPVQTKTVEQDMEMFVPLLDTTKELIEG